jgi:hypothetical protein
MERIVVAHTKLTGWENGGDCNSNFHGGDLTMRAGRLAGHQRLPRKGETAHSGRTEETGEQRQERAMDEDELRSLADEDLHEKMSGVGDRSPQRYRMQQELDRRVVERVARDYLRWTRFAAYAAIVAAAFAVMTLIVTLITRDW